MWKITGYVSKNNSNVVASVDNMAFPTSMNWCYLRHVLEVCLSKSLSQCVPRVCPEMHSYLENELVLNYVKSMSGLTQRESYIVDFDNKCKVSKKCVRVHVTLLLDVFFDNVNIVNALQVPSN